MSSKYITFYTGKDQSAVDQFLQITRAFSVLEELISTYVLKAGDTMSGTLNTVELLPVTSMAYNLGSESKRYNILYASAEEIVSGNVTGNIIVRQANSSVITNFTSTIAGTISVTVNPVIGAATFTGGMRTSSTGLATLNQTGTGSTARGFIFSSHASAAATATIPGLGATFLGSIQTATSFSGILNLSGTGSTFLGAISGGTVNAIATGSIVIGHCGTQNSLLDNTHSGGVILGRANGGAVISLTGSRFGGLATGYAQGVGALITVAADGGRAGGYSVTNAISALFSGAWAYGDSTLGAITANAVNAAQYGPGVNGVPNSFKVGGSGIRLWGVVQPVGPAPAGAVNGDIWVDAAGAVCILSAGIVCVCTFPAM